MKVRLGVLSCAVAAVALIGVSAAHAEDQYGAIAYSPNGQSLGMSWNYDNQADAEQVALQHCRQRARGCTGTLWFKNACGAVANASDGSWGLSWGEDEDTAQNNALARCGQFANDCQVQQSVCTSNVGEAEAE